MKNDKQTKVVRNLISPLRRGRMENYLENMAEKGWMLEEAYPDYWRFRRTEPKKIHFSVVYPIFPEEDFVSEETKKREFFELFANGGWTPIPSARDFQVFYSESARPTPIDAKTELWQTKKAVRTQLFVRIVTLFLWYCIVALRYESNYSRDPLESIASLGFVAGGLCWGLGVLLLLSGVLCYGIWLVRMNRRLRAGLAISKNAPRGWPFQISNIILWLSLELLIVHYVVRTYSAEAVRTVIILVTLFVFSLVLFAVWLSRLLQISPKNAKKKWKILCLCLAFGILLSGLIACAAAEDRRNESMYTVTYSCDGKTETARMDEVTLDIRAVCGKAESLFENRRLGFAESPWLRYEHCRCHECIISDDYVSVEYRLVWIQDEKMHNTVEEKCRKQMIGAYHPEVIEIPAESWRALHVYVNDREHPREYLVDYGDCMLLIEFRGEWEPDAEQMGILTSQLGK